MIARIIDRGTGKPRLNSRECDTCVFGPTNANLRPGRLRELIRENTGDGKMGLVCHETIDYNPDGENIGDREAICRGFYDRFGEKTNGIRVMERLGGFTEVDPPSPEELDKIRKEMADG